MAILITEKQATVRSQILNDVSALFRHMEAVFNGNMGLVWQNPDPDLNPQVVFNAFDKDGGELMRLAFLLKTTINTAKPGTIPDTPVPATVNPDGTVTVTIPQA